MDVNLLAILLAVLALLAMLALNVPVAFSLMAAGFLGILLLDGTATPEAVAQSVPFVNAAQFTWVVIPLFILMGTLITSTGLVSSLFDFARKYLERLPGGVGVAAIAACAGFAAVSGSSVATAAALAPIAVREMVKSGFKASFAAGVVASGGTLGVLIPPSVILVLYGIVAQEPIGSLLVAGIVPGIISALVMASTVVVLYKFHPSATRSVSKVQVNAGREFATVGAASGNAGGRLVEGPVLDFALGHGSVSDAEEVPIQPRRTGSWLPVLQIGILFAVVLGSIYSGLATTTEAAALGCLVAIALAVVGNIRSGVRQTVAGIWDALVSSASQTGMLFLVIIGSSVFTYFFVLAGAPNAFTNWILSLGLSPIGVVILVLLATIPLGMFLESFSMILIVVPLSYPVIVTELGFDGIWFGILLVKTIELSLITPPIGLNVFVVSGVLKGIVTTWEAFKGVAWFVVVDLALIALFVAFPDLVTFWVPQDLQ
jgi:C4-dicarboxylate transporter, DctM subunit